MNNILIRVLTLSAMSVWLVACQATAPTAVPEPCQLSLQASAPVTVASDGAALLVSVTLNGHSRLMQLATGSNLTRLRTRLWTGNDQQRSLDWSNDLGFYRLLTIYTQSQFQFDRLHGPIRVVLAPENLRAGSTAIDGSVGINVLGNADIDLDIAGGRLRLYRATGQCASPHAALRGPTYEVAMVAGGHAVPHPVGRIFHEDLRPYLRIKIHGQKLIALVDTRLPVSIMFSRAAIATKLWNDTSSLIRREPIMGSRDRYPVRRLDALQLGPLTLHNVQVGIYPGDSDTADMVIGLDILEKVHLWLSRSSGTAVLQYPPEPSDP